MLLRMRWYGFRICVMGCAIVDVYRKADAVDRLPVLLYMQQQGGILVGRRRNPLIAQGMPEPPARIGHVHPVHAEGAVIALPSCSPCPCGAQQPREGWQQSANEQVQHGSSLYCFLCSSDRQRSETWHPIVSSGLEIGWEWPAAGTAAEPPCAMGRRRIRSVVPRQELDLQRTPLAAGMRDVCVCSAGDGSAPSFHDKNLTCSALHSLRVCGPASAQSRGWVA
jgi:hypothetical protein